MSFSGVNPEKNIIPVEEINMATENFSSAEYNVGEGETGVVHRRNILERLNSFKLTKGSRYNVVKIMSKFNHRNIISSVSYSAASIKCLDRYLHDPDTRRNLTWTVRLSICIDIARGLECLHTGLGDNWRVVHGDLQSINILLDDFKAKIFDVGLSQLIHGDDQPQTRTGFYVDPIYKETGVLNIESDIYSFGIILFEMLTGMLVHIERLIGDDPQPQRLINIVRRNSHDDKVNNLVDPSIKDHIDIHSVLVFKEIAYQCISWNLKERPMMNTVINRLDQALNIQKLADASKNTIRSYQPQNLDILRIPFEEILFATDNFSEHKCIGSGGLGKVYKGSWHNRIVAIKRLNQDSQGEDGFRKELEILSRFHHQNIISLVGYCDQDNEMIIVSDYASSRSLDSYLQDPVKGCSIKWVQRLKICLGVAKGIDCLHSGLEVENIVIHRDIKSKNILLDDNLEAKISDFGLSLLVDRYQPPVYHLLTGTSYMDPIYSESGIVNTELDVYAFGVVMLEMLSGTLVNRPRKIRDDQPQTLTNLVRRYYYDDGPGILSDPLIRDQINIHSFHVFAKIAYRCVSYNLKGRPTMKRIIKRIEEALEIQTRTNIVQGETSTVLTRSLKHQDLKRFQIPLKDIKYVADKKNRIGDGGFGKVYQGQVPQRLPNYIVAIKCLDPEGLQGKKEFLTEVELISSFHHPNIIPFVGYCDEGEQMIMVSEYAVNGSLDHHLSDPVKRKRLTWMQRLKICLGAAKGIDYLHSGPGKGRVIHRDVKSGNILLDKNLEAKLCDFGLSKQGPINQHTQIYTKAAGTMFYVDPAYHESGILSKESDVYSFGVVLFEMLSGALAYNPTTFVDGIPQYLIILVRRCCDNEPKKLIDPYLRDEVDIQCFETFKEIAYQCINFKSQERPTMDTIIDRLEDAIEFQELKMKRDEKEIEGVEQLESS